MLTAPTIKIEGTRLDQCVQGAQSAGIGRLSTGDGGADRGYRTVRGAREGPLGSGESIERYAMMTFSR